MIQTGRVTVKADGSQLRSKPGASIDIGGLRPTNPGVTDQGVFYAMDQWQHAIVKATMIHMSDTDMASLRAFRGGTVTFSTDTGVTLTVANAVCELGELANGEVPVTFYGSPAK